MDRCPDRPEARRTSTVTTAVLALSLLASACSGGASPNKTHGPSSTQVLTPAALTAQIGVLTVTLLWSQPKGGAKVATYNIFRDDALLFSVSAPATTYIDHTADPGKTYKYEVQAYGTTGVSGRASVTVKTPMPDVSLAKLDGDFDVKVKLLSKRNLFNIPGHFTLGWHFKAKCSTGPCDVVWNDLSGGSIRGTLKRQVLTYKGKVRGKYGVHCGRTVTVSILTFSLKVVQGTANAGEWLVQKLTGSLNELDPPSLGCTGGSASYSITATLL